MILFWMDVKDPGEASDSAAAAAATVVMMMMMCE